MTNVIKFQSPFERIKLFHDCPEVRLYKAIIMQAVIDATNISDDREAKKFEIEAKKWIFEKDEDFQEMCDLVNLEPTFIIKVTKALIKLQKAKKFNKSYRHKMIQVISKMQAVN